MPEWTECPWYENCLGQCIHCDEDGNPVYEGAKDSRDMSDISEALEEILRKHFFHV